FVESDILKLPFPAGRFRYASDMGCFHTLPPRLRVPYAREISRVLRPGGLHVLSWAAREATQEVGPPHRLSVADVGASLEGQFLFERVEYSEGGPRLPHYTAILRRRTAPQPPPR
ncbi:MAG: class I SAM-dependent methyltransferase, partial [Thermoplasmata archaeon]